MKNTLLICVLFLCFLSCQKNKDEILPDNTIVFDLDGKRVIIKDNVIAGVLSVPKPMSFDLIGNNKNGESLSISFRNLPQSLIGSYTSKTATLYDFTYSLPTAAPSNGSQQYSPNICPSNNNDVELEITDYQSDKKKISGRFRATVCNGFSTLSITNGVFTNISVF